MNEPATKGTPKTVHERRLFIFFAWAIMLFISDLSAILSNAIFNQVPEWLGWAKVGVVAIFIVACLIWKSLRPLWQFAVVFFVFRLVLNVTEWTRDSDWWKSAFAGPKVSFAVNNTGIFILDTLVAIAVIVALWILKHRRSEFFLVKGQADAPVEPVRWLGIGKGESWRVFGWIFAVLAAVAVFIPTVLSMSLAKEMVVKAIPLFPFAVLFAGINAFNEEIYFRASLFSTLHQLIGKTQVLWINVVFFGLAHYIGGSPPGILGALMTGFLAFLLGKSMLETKGLLWAWIIHFLPDVVVFASYTFGWVNR